MPCEFVSKKCLFSILEPAIVNAEGLPSFINPYIIVCLNFVICLQFHCSTLLLQKCSRKLTCVICIIVGSIVAIILLAIIIIIAVYVPHNNKNK